MRDAERVLYLKIQASLIFDLDRKSKLDAFSNVLITNRSTRRAGELIVIGRANARPITRRSAELSKATVYRKSDNQ